MTVEEQVLVAALHDDEDLVRELLRKLNRPELIDLSDALDLMDDVVMELLGRSL